MTQDDTHINNKEFPVVRAPGRVNLIGDHTDYAGGLVLPMAIQLCTEIAIHRRITGSVRASSSAFEGEVNFELPISAPRSVQPSWGRYLAGVAALVDTPSGFAGAISSTIPHGSGLSSSAALEVAAAYALGVTGTPVEIAELCQEAEFVATGVPCGIMDQLVSVAGVQGHGLLIDCATLTYVPVPIPDDVSVWVIHSGQERQLADSEYAERHASCHEAAELIGPLPTASLSDIATLPSELLQARARHVRTECDRVTLFAEALQAEAFAQAGELMQQSHHSLAADFAVSTPQLDALVNELNARNDVYGARLTGAGFGGCVVALAHKDADLLGIRDRAWRVHAGDGAARLNSFN